MRWKLSCPSQLDTARAPGDACRAMPSDAPRAQLIHISTDRRLGHEWDEWDGQPLPGNGDFSAAPALFFGFAALTLAAGMGGVAAVLFLLSPRLAGVWRQLPHVAWAA